MAIDIVDLPIENGDFQYPAAPCMEDLAYIWVIYGVHVGKYCIYGAYLVGGFNPSEKY